MKTILKTRWILFAMWVAAAILLTAVAPNVNNIIRERGQSALSEDAPSAVADAILAKMETTEGTRDLIVFYNEDGITDSDKRTIETAVGNLQDQEENLGITEMIDPFSMPEAASSLYSEDGTTLMVSVKVDKGDQSVDDLKESFDKELKGVSTEYYLSGEDFINNDYQTKAESGVEKSAALTVLFILIVLIVVFRSVITPLISLIGVAVSYMVANGIAAQLIDKADFPVTSLTTMLMILILFGIGTDYNILLFSRFREELSHGKSTDDAILTTYKTAGKTIFFSILTVIVAFAALIFAGSPIYRSGAIVVVGVITLLFEILTFTPFMMKVFGRKLFWPSKRAAGHKESRLWGGMSSFATRHPFVTFAFVVAAFLPMIIGYKDQLSFNLVGELGDTTASSKGFNLVAEHFGAGQTMTTTIVIEADQTMDNNSWMAWIDQVTEQVNSIKGVSKVSSVTRPEGEKIAGLYLGSQINQVADGLSQSGDGLTSIYQGMEQAQSQTGSTQMDQIIDSLKQISAGLDQTDSYLTGIDADGVFYMPDQLLTAESYAPVLANFFSKDRTITKLSVVLKDDPYSEAAQDTVKEIRSALKTQVNNTTLPVKAYGVAGTSASTLDTNQVLTEDLQRTAVIVIIGILLILLVVIRSFWESIAIVASLAGAFFAADFVMNLIFIHFLGYEGISSFVPFFAFIVIMALGVDYSIFLMSRMKEYKNVPAGEAIVAAARQMGGVVISAIIILGGTFATLAPSGMLMLEELAVAVIVGLIALCLVLLPLFLPSAIALKGKIDAVNYMRLKDTFEAEPAKNKKSPETV